MIPTRYEHAVAGESVRNAVNVFVNSLGVIDNVKE
jgi:hypothetical protein